MKHTIKVINRMEADGIIGRYAIGGAFAAYYYVEPTVTDDVDILVSLDEASGATKAGLISLAPIFSYLKAAGYEEFRQGGLVIEGWPVQFLPVADDLDGEALVQANEVDVQISESETVKARVMRPEHIVATCLRVRRTKDFLRINQFLEEDAVDLELLCNVLDRHDLKPAWRSFCRRAGMTDPYEVGSKT